MSILYIKRQRYYFNMVRAFIEKTTMSVLNQGIYTEKQDHDAVNKINQFI